MDKMTSVHSTANCVDHRLPALDKAFKLQGFALVKRGDFFELCDLHEHQRQIIEWPLSRPRHLGVAHQRVSAEDDALVCVGWAHRVISRQKPRAVNGGLHG